MHLLLRVVVTSVLSQTSRMSDLLSLAACFRFSVVLFAERNRRYSVANLPVLQRRSRYIAGNAEASRNTYIIFSANL